jgi:hypothetical protein
MGKVDKTHIIHWQLNIMRRWGKLISKAPSLRMRKLEVLKVF